MESSRRAQGRQPTSLVRKSLYGSVPWLDASFRSGSQRQGNPAPGIESHSFCTESTLGNVAEDAEETLKSASYFFRYILIGHAGRATNGECTESSICFATTRPYLQTSVLWKFGVAICSATRDNCFPNCGQFFFDAEFDHLNLPSVQSQHEYSVRHKM